MCVSVCVCVCVCVLSFCLMFIRLREFFNAKAVLVEEQQYII